MKILIHFFILQLSAAEIFTSSAHVESLINANKEVPQMLENYINMEGIRVQTLRRLISVYKAKNQQVLAEDVNALANPIKTFLFIKHFVADWDGVEKFMTQNTAKGFIWNIAEDRTKRKIEYPTNEDLAGAASAIFRIQDVYRLSAKELSNGKILHIDSNQTWDCLLIGRLAYKTKDYYHTLLWLQEAYDKIQQESDPSYENLQEILDKLSFSLFKQGNVKRALLIAEELLKIAPNHKRAAKKVKLYAEKLKKDGLKLSEFRENIPPLENRRNAEEAPQDDEHNIKIYEALCRNEIPPSVQEFSMLYCYYKRDRPYLLIAPFKTEIVRFDPLAVVFHKVISDEEISIIQELSHSRLERAQILNHTTQTKAYASYRISKSAWLHKNEHKVVDRINRRVELMTNLAQETAEEIQVGNYGLGGHYESHTDFFHEGTFLRALREGNRIATLLFYMSQPEIGGATVFTRVNTTILPLKNGALFWYNLERNGQGDFRTQHGACPVLVGVKWVANKWIREIGQEFRRPCGLQKSDKEAFVGDLGGPVPRNHANIRSF
ncbi:unnamed protein product [Dracunculus medinensis]|uniref:procollagen-proline 4-dioxygenase n=1 Tax=Dracunculus medinensis TaxID=318479 RepID=A0A0N4U2B0_DRAME|nr:unnamed protein product [Dracunculus medinensis]